MELQVLFNSSATSKNFATGWGVSFLINKRILFDAGERGEDLMKNMDRLKIDLSLIESLVISHDHWDHVGGLETVLEIRKGVKIYGCPGFDAQFKNKVKQTESYWIEKDSFSEIKSGIMTTGEIIGEYKSKTISEQSLIVDTPKGLVLITGCAHPGILTIVRRILDHYKDKKIYCVLGGLHLIGKKMRSVEALAEELKELGIKKIGATHCTGSEAENVFKKVFQSKFISMKVGERIVIN